MANSTVAFRDAYDERMPAHLYSSTHYHMRLNGLTLLVLGGRLTARRVDIGQTRTVWLV